MKTAVLICLSSCGIGSELIGQSRPVSLTRRIEYWNPAWSPDSRTIVFESTLDGRMSIYTIAPGGTDLTRLTVDTFTSGQPSWSPDGKRIVFSSNRGGDPELYLMNADGSAQARLTTMPGTGGGYYQAFFSPDGWRVAFQGRPDWAETRDRVYVIGSDGTGMRQLSDSAFGAEGPRWTPDGRITFDQVPYPKRYWADMVDGDLQAAKAGTRLVAIRPDGTGFAPAQATPPRTKDAPIPGDAEPSPDGRWFAYTRAVSGWNGLYLYDVNARSERLILGGPGAGPIGYLRTATLSAITDTLDTWLGPRGGTAERRDGNYVVRTLRQVGAQRWEFADAWHDSTGHVTARQSTRTLQGSLATEIESVRALGDSATLLVTPGHVTAWVVPQGQPPRLFDGNSQEERYAGAIVNTAIARSKPAAGRVFLFPSSALYGANPLESRTDSLRVVRRDTLYRGNTPVPVVVLERFGGGQFWLEESTGATVLSRGNAGPERWWWHIRRGIKGF